MSQQLVLAAQKANSVLGWVRQSITCRLREVILPLCQALVRPRLQCWAHFWAPHYNRDMGILGGVHEGL